MGYLPHAFPGGRQVQAREPAEEREISESCREVEKSKTYLVHNSSIVEGDGEGVRDVSLLRIVVVDSELLVFDTLNLRNRGSVSQAKLFFLRLLRIIRLTLARS